MSRNKIIIVQQNNYENKSLRKKIFDVFTGLDLFQTLEKKGVKSILIKPNLVGKYKKDSAVITHPEIVRATTMILNERGYSVAIAESSSSFLKMQDVWEYTEYNDLKREKLADLINLNRCREFRKLELKNKKVSAIFVAEDIFKYDYIISMPKLKTHAISGLTCAVKNFYGMLSGPQKLKYHWKIPDFKDFNRFLIDIYEVFHADLYVVDAIQVMDGNGPILGKKKELDLIIAGYNGLDIDIFLNRMICKGKRNDTELYSIKKNIYVPLLPEKIITEINPEKAMSGFKAIKKNIFKKLKDKIWVFNFIFLRSKLYIDQKKCVQCYKCECPFSAIVKIGKNGLTTGRPMLRILSDKCVLCGLCRELCEYDAICFERSKLRIF